MPTQESPLVSLRGITQVPGSETNGAPMTGPEQLRRAEELAAQAHKLLGQGDGQATAGGLSAAACALASRRRSVFRIAWAV